MHARVKLSEIIVGMESPSEDTSSYLDLRTLKVVRVTDDDFGAAEEDKPLEDFPDWQQETIKLARQILEDDEYFFVEVPSRFDIDEYAIMEDFCSSPFVRRGSHRLEAAIQGKGAFRRFREEIRRQGLEDQFYEFRDEVLKKIAVEWCEENHIGYFED